MTPRYVQRGGSSSRIGLVACGGNCGDYTAEGGGGVGGLHR